MPIDAPAERQRQLLVLHGAGEPFPRQPILGADGNGAAGAVGAVEVLLEDHGIGTEVAAFLPGPGEAEAGIAGQVDHQTFQFGIQADVEIAGARGEGVELDGAAGLGQACRGRQREIGGQEGIGGRNGGRKWGGRGEKGRKWGRKGGNGGRNGERKGGEWGEDGGGWEGRGEGVELAGAAGLSWACRGRQREIGGQEGIGGRNGGRKWGEMG